MIKKENYYRFSLYLEDEVINETMFSADVFNPVVRYSVDIRKNITLFINKLQKVLSSKSLNYTIHFNDKSYNLLNNYKNNLKLFNKDFGNKLVLPADKTVEINGKKISGVEFKFGFYINDNPIVEITFYVKGYNPSSRFSTELSLVVNEISNQIYESLKNSDVDHMWDDYDLINNYNLHINQVRELTKEKRYNLLNDLKNKKLSYIN